MRKKKKIILKNILFFLGLIILSFSIGFSAFQESMLITDTIIDVKIEKDVRITDLSIASVASEAIASANEYNVKNIFSDISLPNNDSSVTYSITIKNIGNIESGILDITGLTSNLKYELLDYNLGDILCDNSNSSKCKLGSTSTILLKISYAENGYDSTSTNYNLNLTFDFRRFYSITYIGFSNTSSLPTSILRVTCLLVLT